MWLIIGLAVGAALLALVRWVRSRRIVLKPLDWLIGAFGLGLLLFAIQNYTASIDEHEEIAAGSFLRIFGIPSIVLLIIFVLILLYRRKSAYLLSTKQKEYLTNK